MISKLHIVLWIVFCFMFMSRNKHLRHTFRHSELLTWCHHEFFLNSPLVRSVFVHEEWSGSCVHRRQKEAASPDWQENITINSSRKQPQQRENDSKKHCNLGQSSVSWEKQKNMSRAYYTWLEIITINNIKPLHKSQKRVVPPIFAQNKQCINTANSLNFYTERTLMLC